MEWRSPKLDPGLDNVEGDLEGLEKDDWEIEGKGKKRKLTTSDTMTLGQILTTRSYDHCA